MSFRKELYGLLRLRLLQLATLAGVLIGTGAYSFRLKYCVLDPDIWWHLKVGDWIIQHHDVPHTGIFSRTATDIHWVAYSWGYEVLLSLAYRGLGLLGVGLFGTALTMAVAVILFWMLRRLSGRFWLALGLSVVTCVPTLFSLMPRPVFFTILLFTITLTLVVETQRTGRVQSLYWLPLLFLVWANLHIQFVYGLGLLSIFVVTNIAQRLMAKLRSYPDFLLLPTLPLDRLLYILAACVSATFLNPYWIHLYQVILEYSRAKFAYSIIIELQAIDFRFSEHYVQLLLTVAAFFAVGWQQKLDPFKVILLTICSVVAYRTMRDTWFICIPAAACIADLVAGREEGRDKPETAIEVVGVAAFVFLGLCLFARNLDFTERGLDRAASSEFPVNAVNFLRSNPVRGPLYNNLTWGGFLIWYMPTYPVAVDGRNDLYGDTLDKLFYETESGTPSYTANAYLNESGVVLLDRTVPLADRLRSDTRFKLIFEDGMAVVYERQ